jgi:hypothetical protein
VRSTLTRLAPAPKDVEVEEAEVAEVVEAVVVEVAEAEVEEAEVVGDDLFSPKNRLIILEPTTDCSPLVGGRRLL